MTLMLLLLLICCILIPVWDEYAALFIFLIMPLLFLCAAIAGLIIR